MSENRPPPVVYHPIPRRPFVVSPATPPEDFEKKEDTKDGRQRQRSSEYARFLEPQQQNADSSTSALSDLSGNPAAAGSADISRAQSILNLTSSTLFGIFSPTVTTRGSIDGGTPWGTGAETPARDLFEENADAADDNVDGERTAATEADLDEVRRASQSLMMLQRQRRRGESFGVDGVSGIKLAPAPAGRGSKVAVSGSATAPASVPSFSKAPQMGVLALFSIAGRAALLFALGMGYGVLVSRLRSETHAPFDDVSVPSPSETQMASTPKYDAIYDWRYLVSWGVSGVVLGTLLPWFDGVWDRAFGRGASVLGKSRTAPETDWALVVRGIGAFAGVVFAMRKLPWASTMQASLTLALANPFLWYLLDRSKSGLLLAAAVGFIGSGVLMALNLDLMPNPYLHDSPYHDGHGASLGGTLGDAAFHQNGSVRNMAASATTGSSDSSISSPGVTVETAIWMLSVLFCSCVCFGNIGRRLALRPVPAAHER